MVPSSYPYSCQEAVASAGQVPHDFQDPVAAWLAYLVELAGSLAVGRSCLLLVDRASVAGEAVEDGGAYDAVKIAAEADAEDIVDDIVEVGLEEPRAEGEVLVGRHSVVQDLG